MTTPFLSKIRSEIDPRIVNLDESIAHFSDGNLLIDQKGRNSVEESIIRRFSPPGLEEQFQQLYSIIFSNLYRSPPQKGEDGTTVSTSNSRLDVVSSSSAAILMGSKGSGKSLLLERCLAACQEHQLHRHRKGPLFRMVSINGIVCRGQDVASVVYEIIRQLSEIAFHCSESSVYVSPNSSDTEDLKEIGRKRQKMDRHLLRLRKSAFTSNLALLESTLKIADADGIPILLVLDELDSFTEEGERQMLLYHFLDRVATPGSNLILIGITSSFSALTLLEKRIRSRAEGTAKVIYLRNPATYSELLKVLRHKLTHCVVGEDVLARMSCLPGQNDGTRKGRQITGSFAQSTTTDASHINDSSTSSELKINESVLYSIPDAEREEAAQISVAMDRELRLGKDLRWYSRVISSALSLYRYQCVMTSAAVNFHAKHLLNALVMMGASISDTTAASNQPDICIVDGIAVDPRLQSLLDLSPPQVALLLSAKRILTRQTHKDHAVVAPLVIERMIKEYDIFRRKSSLAQFSNSLLRNAAMHLLDVGLLVPATDHSGGGSLHYSVTKSYRNFDSVTLSRIPLQIPIEIDRELGTALEQNVLSCPTALKEWGKATN